ncbi:hypothetical protein IPA_09060 [Ignicoccus pacificus DSM 13166]|uniref:Uncharacterized protein n=1 Tax=Ignicoccus pacificus DSM 13166 TaxID=940294 RepID=A0A977KDF3_9CREN|nr:hypothetical protein IPA_09060 [Ignicoccus pacificus DSM 13166]
MASVVSYVLPPLIAYLAIRKFVESKVKEECELFQ